MTNPELEMREKLPSALQVLLEEYPRAEWTNNDRFEGLVSFWLDRHLMFRRLLEAMRADSMLMLDQKMEQSAFQSRLNRYGNMLVQQLHGHHHVEDSVYFPVLEKRDIRLKRGFEILDADHVALDRRLEGFTLAANAVLHIGDAGSVANETGNLMKTLDQFGVFLNRHLIDEEELIVPLILKYGAQGLEP